MSDFENYEEPMDGEDYRTINGRRYRIKWAKFWKDFAEERHVEAVVKNNQRRTDEMPLAYIHRIAETAGLIPDGTPLFFEGTQKWPSHANKP